MIRASIVAFSLILILVACATTAPTTLEGTECPTGQIPQELGGCCADADGDATCDPLTVPADEPEVPADEPDEPTTVNETAVNETLIGPETPAPDAYVTGILAQYEDRVRTYSYYLESPHYGRLWVWHEDGRDRYISVENLFEVQRNRVNGTKYGYQRTDTSFIYRIEDRSLPVANYVEYDRNTSTYHACYVERTRYAISQCIKDYPNGNPILYGGVKFAPTRDPIAWLAQFEGMKPSSPPEELRFRDADGRTYDAFEMTFTQQNGDNVTFTIHKTYGAPLRITSADKHGNSKESFAPDRFAFNSQSTVEGDPRLEPSYEYRQ